MDEPTKPADPTAEAKRSRGIPGYVVWGFAIVLIYVLSAGPVGVLEKKGMLRRSIYGFLDYFYAPLEWAYWHTPLHKPFGIYMHLWCPDNYAANGDQR